MYSNNPQLVGQWWLTKPGIDLKKEGAFQ